MEEAEEEVTPGCCRIDGIDGKADVRITSGFKEGLARSSGSDGKTGRLDNLSRDSGLSVSEAGFTIDPVGDVIDSVTGSQVERLAVSMSEVAFVCCVLLSLSE